MSPGAPWRLGLAGAGAFGTFVLTALAPLPGVTLAAVAARTPERRAAAIRAWQEARAVRGLPCGPVAEYADALALAESPDLDCVLVAVPPDLQPAVALAAIAGGKAVFLEKPGALSAAGLAAVAAAAARRGVPAALNLVMRASPILERIRRWYRAGWLGQPERWHLENWAGGELPPGHWFWDRHRSGGVLVEHGVHFFDEVAWVLAARPLRAWGQYWPHPRRAEAAARVLAVVEYAGPGGPVPASFYHGFVRPAGDEHQVRELGFTRARIRVTGWVPERLEAELDLPPAAREDLARDPLVSMAPGAGNRVRVEMALPDRAEAYREMIRAGFRALLDTAAGAGEPLAPLAAGVTALAVAEAATGAGEAGPAPVRVPAVSDGSGPAQAPMRRR